MHEFTACATVACYLPARDEVDPGKVIARAWRAKKRVYAPVVDDNGGMEFCRLTSETKLIRNRYGLWEPITGSRIAAQDIDLVITPVVAFDNYRHRIGMGSAYFDRCFAFLRHRKHWLRPKLLGLAFECQRVEKINPNPWDIPLYQIVTERR
jgi:5-formyltetrahydrofolate cyclo-ligase